MTFTMKHFVSAAILLVLAVPAFSQIMITFDHNEHMYVAAAALIRDGEAIYRDFSFLQMPYLPFLLAGLYALTHTTHLLVVGKLVSFAFLVLSVIVLYLITWRRSGSALLAFSLGTVLITHPIVLRSASEASNYLMPLACSLVSYLLFVEFSKGEKWLAMSCSGFALALAIGARLTYLLLLPAFFLVFLIPSRYSRSGKENLSGLLAFTAGLLVGLFPALFLFMREPRAFLFNNIGYHQLNARLFDLTGYERAMSLPEKVDYASTVLVLAENLTLILALALFLILYLYYRRAGGAARPASLGVDLSACLLVLSLVGTFIPTPLWPQYFAMPVPFVLVLLSCLYPQFSAPGKKAARFTLWVVIAVLLLIYAPGMLDYSKVVSASSGWSGVVIHRQAQRIKRNMEPIQEGDRVATLSPLYALEAGLPIYDELASGPFVYRVGDLLEPAERSTWRVISPDTIEDLFDREPPRAILVGFEKGLDDPLERYAQSHNYQRVAKDFNGGILYVCCQE
jgi:4-amino-4-deoxy-L-arabinose transferase-like glycosyltransferase